MFSKKTFTVIFVLLGITSCTPKLGEAPPEVTQQKLEGSACLSEISPMIDSYFKGAAPEAEIVKGWDCASLSIKRFKKYVYGRTADRYTSQELTEFMEKNFLSPSSPKVSDELRLQFMKLKQLFVGGTAEDVTRDELDKLLGMFDDLKSISLRLNPYMRVIVQNWSLAETKDTQSDIKFFESASTEIQSAAADLAALVVKNNQTYQLDDFVSFMKEFSQFYGQKWTFPEELGIYMPIIKKIKRAIAGGDQNSIGPVEWNSFVLLGVRGYIQYLRYFYFIKSAAETGSGIRLGYLARSMEDMLDAFQDLLVVKPVDPVCGVYKEPAGNQKILSCISKTEMMDILRALSEVWKEFRISAKLVDEAMKIKKVYFGGSSESITSMDFERGKKKVAGLKAIVEKFMPYYPIYSLEWDRGNMDPVQAQQFFKEAQNSLQSSAGDLGLLFEDSYNLTSIVSLLAEIDVLYPGEDPNHKLADQVGRYLPMVKDVKSILFSERQELIKKEQWAAFLKYSARFYSSYLYYHFFVEGEKPGSAVFLDSFAGLTNQILDISKDITLTKKNQMITESEVKLLVQRFMELELLPKGLSSASTDTLVKVLLNRVLWPAEHRLRGAVPNGITPVSLEHLRSEFQIWYETERFALVLGANPLRHGELQVAIAKKLKDQKIRPALKVGLSELSLVAAGAVAQTVDSHGHQIISNTVRPLYNQQSLSTLNFNRALARVTIRSSTESKSRLEGYEGVSLSESQALFKQVRPALVDLKIMAPENVTFIDARFRDANIFTAHGNGDSYVNFAEMVDIFGMLYSGVTVNSQFRKDIEGRCLSSHTVIDLKTSIDEACLRKVYFDRIEDYLTATPEYVRFYKRTNRDQFTVFFKNLLKAAGYVPVESGRIKLTDSDLTPHVIQYVEMVMSRFDVNSDGIISTSESIKAFPAFKGILEELTKDQSVIKQKDLLALFTYILYYGQPPGGVKDYLLKWLPWKGSPEKWAVAADRGDLASILGYIADQVAKSNKSLMSHEVEGSIRRDPSFREDTDSQDHTREIMDLYRG